MKNVAHVAQLAEHVLGKDEVTRSIRVVGSISRRSRSGPLSAVLCGGMDWVSGFY